MSSIDGGNSRTADAGEAPALRLTGLTKRYPGVLALDEVDFSVGYGEVRALLGRNGAGKSTLVKILSGAVAPDSGQIEVGGRTVSFAAPLAARAAGIETVYQDLSLVPTLTVRENLLMGDLPKSRFGRRLGVTDRRTWDREAKDALARVHLDVDPGAMVSALPIADRQRVEIAKALRRSPRLLALDEPTSSLDSREAEALIEIVRRLAIEGIAVIYVSHRMSEITRVADSLTVLRDGRKISDRSVENVSTEDIVVDMTGHSFARVQDRGVSTEENGSPNEPDHASEADVVLSMRSVFLPGRISNVDIHVRRGEVVGIAGLLGCGSRQLIRTAFGLEPETSLDMWLNGDPIIPVSPRQMLSLGVGLVPEDRKTMGLVLGQAVATNLTMASLSNIARGGIVSRARERFIAESNIKELGIETPSQSQAVRLLSGGNQQKIVVGKIFNANVDLLLLDEPTRGVDIKAKEQIYSLIRGHASRGTAVLMASSDLDDLFACADRIIVMRSGRITDTYWTAETSRPEVLSATLGVGIGWHPIQ